MSSWKLRLLLGARISSERRGEVWKRGEVREFEEGPALALWLLYCMFICCVLLLYY